MPKGKLRWKKEPAQTGLARIGAGPRGSKYWDGETEYAHTHAKGGDWREPLQGWFLSCPPQDGIPHRNTCDEPLFETEAEAKKAAAAYIKECLGKK